MDTTENFDTFIADGWTTITDDGFIGLVGPFFYKERDGGGLDLCFPTQDKHRNRNGYLQGGALMTFIDRAFGMTVRTFTGAIRTVTVQLDVHFIDAVKLGEVVEVSPEVVRATKQIVFMTAKLTVGSRTVALANGVWKRIADTASSPRSEEETGNTTR